MDILKYNSKAWDVLGDQGDKWTVPVDEATVARARNGDWSVQLTSLKPTPRDWFPENMKGLDILCLASGGGQQGPTLAAAGAKVTVFDASVNQLAQDRMVAEREGLDINTVQGDMADLSCFEDASFDLVFNPVSNVFAENIIPVWQEAARVLKPGATLLSGFVNPLGFIFDLADYESGKLTVRHKIPYADNQDLTKEELKNLVTDENKPVCFGHTLHDQIQGQIDAGLVITGFFEDRMGEDDPLNGIIDVLIATRAVKASL
jgi:SAM-dependent methyltransferase